MTRTVSSSESAHAVLDQPALEAWGRRVGEAVAVGEIGPPLVVVLRGPLGAGKSVLARAMARGAGVTGSMPSPTYNLLFSYEGTDLGAGDAGVPLEVKHLDLYRLEHPDDVWELGWQELGEGRQLVLIEWPERAEQLLPADRWEITLAFLDDDGQAAALRRRLEVRGLGSAPAVPSLSTGSDEPDASEGPKGPGESASKPEASS